MNRPIPTNCISSGLGLVVVRFHFFWIIQLPDALFAILIDGGFITKKIHAKVGRNATAADVCGECDRICQSDLLKRYELLRIYYYDAPPSSESVEYPVSKQKFSLAQTQRYRDNKSLHDQLVLKDNFALRMGETRLSSAKWKIKTRIQKELIKAPRALVDSDFDLDISQKGVDLRIGLDMARLALNERVRAIVVVTGDSDFIPAFKFVRREGLKIILDSMGHNVRNELRVHSDLVLS
ncbi:MAG: NYN domain-containing protein [Beijerinckiaceae bacterium]